MKLVKMFVLAGIMLFMYSCKDDEDPRQDMDEPGTNEVVMENSEFAPGQKTVDIGTTVTWINNDNTTHTVTSNDGLFDATVEDGDSFSFTFTEAGTFDYICTIHPGMDGTIIVTEDTQN